MEKKDLKLSASVSEIARLRAENKQKEVYIAAFKRDIEGIAGCFGQKELEENVHKLYRKYLKEGGGKEEESKKSSTQSKTSVLASKLIHNDGESDDEDFTLGGSQRRPSMTNKVCTFAVRIVMPYPSD